MRIAFIQADWHHEIVEQSQVGFHDELNDQGHGDAAFEIVRVPGALEIPLPAQRLARQGHCDAIVAAAFVVDGGIYRHEFVAATVLDALMRIQLDTDTPIFSVVLTPHNFQETKAHQNFFHNHFRLKGAEAARACLSTMASLEKLKENR